MTELLPIALLANVTLGKMVQPSRKQPDEEYLPYLRAAHIQANGRLDMSVEPKMMWFSPDEQRAYQLRAGDVLLVEGGAVGRSVFLPQDLPGLGFQNALIRLRPIAGTDGRYLDYCLQSAVANGEINAFSTSVSIAHFTAEKVGRFRIPYSQPDRQRAIANYLDRETCQIDAMIAKLDALVEMLKVRRVSAIRRSTQYAEDGAKWRVVPTAHLFASIGSGTTPKGIGYYVESGAGIPWVTTSELRENLVTATFQNVTDEAVTAFSSLHIHPRGSIVIAMYGATIGRLGILDTDAAMNQACCAFSCPRDVDPRFFYYSLWGQRNDLIREAAGGGQPNINQRMLRRWRVPHPPIEEQRRIADRLDEVTGKIDAMLAKVAELKSLLIERRAALITNVITGRKKVA